MTVSPLAPQWLAEPTDPNALDGALWPQGATRNEGGEITLAGLSVTDLARTFGTPLFVVDEHDFRARARLIRSSFEDACQEIGTSAKVYYAGKAFLSTEIARWVSDEGLYLDVCSGGELAVALAAGIDPARLGYHGNNKSVAEIDRGVSAGIGTIVLDSEIEIQRVAEAASRHGVVQDVRLRVVSGVHAHTHAFLATAHEDQKFGVPLSEAPALVDAIRLSPNLRFLGLHCHIGSQIFGSDGFSESAKRLLETHALLLQDGDVPELNLGGGFGIAYTSEDDPTPVPELTRGIVSAVGTECARLGISTPVLAFEPGRVIAGPSTVTVYTVGTVKPVTVGIEAERRGAAGTDTAVRTYVSVDGGMSDNIRTALYEARYTVRLANRASDAEAMLVRIAGKHCESGDIVVSDDYLPADTRPDDLVAVPATGAYCWALANNYNYIGRPPVVAVRDGEARIIIRGETESDILSRDAGVAHAPGRDNT